jgi:hypothetical protein
MKTKKAVKKTSEDKKQVYPCMYTYWRLNLKNGLLRDPGFPICYVTSVAVSSEEDKVKAIKTLKNIGVWLTDFSNPKYLDKVEKYIPGIRDSINDTAKI